MSLQAWLPFTDGTLKQQGLKNVSATIGGTVNLTNAGKLGKCATIGTSAGGITLPASTMQSFTECSVAFWIKIISWNTSYATFFQAGLGSTPWNNYIFGILRNNANSNLCFTLTNSSSSSTSASYVSSNLEVGQWYHLAFVYSTEVCKIYINGVEDKSYNTSYVPNFAGITHISIGRGTNGSNYQTNCSLNDFRIYDHALSPMEVKQLARGLVLHYPLNRGGWGQENLILNSNIEKTVKSTIVQWDLSNEAKENIKGKTYVISADIKCESGTGVIDCYVRSPSTSQSMSSVTIFTDITTEYKRYSLVSICNVAQTGTPETFTFRANGSNGTTTGITFSIKNLKLEYGENVTPWCPNSSDALATTMGLNGTTEYDCSGFCNNGIKNNLPTYSSDTAKYNVSTYLNGVNQTIQLPNLSTLIPDGIFSFSIWFKKETDEWSSKSWETIFGGPSGFEFQSKSGSTNSPLLYAYSWGKGTKAYTLDEWHHFVMVRTTEGTTFYLDGEQAFTGTAGSIPSGNYFLGSWSTTTSQNYKGFMGDARIYATALSADDVLALYNKKI